MASPFIFVLPGLVVLYLGGEALVRGSAALALRLGLEPLVVGRTVVASGTSAPELVASVKAALENHGGIALGNIIGSNIFNLLGILGTAALVRLLDGAGLQMVDLYVMRGFVAVRLPILATGWQMSRWEGALLVAGYLAYLGFQVASIKASARRAAGESARGRSPDGSRINLNPDKEGTADGTD